MIPKKRRKDVTATKLDNYPAHSQHRVLVLESGDGKITARFLPKNTTALIQAGLSKFFSDPDL